MIGLKILITGARGFIGSRLHRALHEIGAEVHGVSRTPETSEADSLRWWHGDLADIQIVRNILSTVRPDVIFHLAGQPTTARDLEMVLPTFHSNLTTTINLLTVATEMGVQTHHCDGVVRRTLYRSWYYRAELSLWRGEMGQRRLCTVVLPTLQGACCHCSNFSSLWAWPRET